MNPWSSLGRASLMCAALATCACQSPAAAEATLEARFGIFYGGQVQERVEIPFEIDRARQLQGIRIDMQPPPREPHEVRWELSLPTGRRRADARGRKALERRLRQGSQRMRPGEPRFEVALPFAVDDPLGLWNIRVLVGERVVIDRPFVVYDPRQRAAAVRRARAAEDAGF